MALVPVPPIWVIAPLAESPLKIPHLPITWIALLWLGVLGTGLAMIMQYYLVHEIGLPVLRL